MRLSHADPLAIAIWRVALSLVFVAVALVVSGSWRQWRRLDRRGVAVAVGAGAALSLHFWTWNASVALTTVAASVVLVNTQPVVVALLSALWLRERPTRRQWLGIAVAMAGTVVVGWPDLAMPAARPGASGGALLGDILALTGAVTAALYYVIGRRLRAVLDLWPYVALVYASCLVVSLILAIAVGASVLHQPAREMGIFLALAIGPMLLGHTSLNWALKYLPAYVVNLTLLGEPVMATIIAALLPGIRELPGRWTVAGGALILAGMYVTTTGNRQ